MQMAIPAGVSKAVAWAALVCLSQGSALLAQTDGAPTAVGLITDVALVDIANGQDIVITSSMAPADFVPQRRSECTYALSVPNVLPDQSIATQFFSSELVQNLTLKAAGGAGAATEICISVSESVRSQVALRANGLTIRLVRQASQGAAPTESFRPAESPSTQPSDPDQGVDQTTPVGSITGPSASERELELALREARVAERELQLEVTELRTQLADQVSANARLDQELSAREGFTDLLTPRIDRLAETLDLRDSGLERPVERFDASLAMLETRLAEARASGTDLRLLHGAVDSLLAEVERTSVQLVMTNDDVNVRLEPSTAALRVAFLPRGVLLRVVEENAGWSRVSAGDFEGWIFAELLTALASEPVLDGSADAAQQIPTDRASRVDFARDRVAAVKREMALVSGQLASQTKRVGELEAQNAALATDLAGARSAGETLGVHQEQANQLRAEVDRLNSALAQAQADAQQARARLEAEREQVAAASAASSNGDDRGEGELEAVRRRIEGLASLARLDREVVTIREKTNLRRGPSVNEERLALLPTGFKVAVLSSTDGWYEVVYGSLHGWISGDYATLVEGAEPSGGSGSEPEAVTESEPATLASLLDRLERSIAAAKIAAPEFASGSAVVNLEEGTRASDGQLMQAAANALYARAAAWRRGDVDAYIAAHSPAYEPEQGNRPEWESEVRSKLSGSELPDARVQGLRLRLVADNVIAATYQEVSSKGSVARKVDLALDGGSWLVLLDTEQAPASAIE